MKGFFVIIITLAIMGWLAAQARTARAQKVGQNWVFPLVRGLQVICFAVFSLGATFIVWGYLGPQSDRTTLVLGGLLIVAFSVVAWPKAVYVSASGIQQRSWWGGWKTLTWAQISEAKERPDGYMVLRGDGVKIIFTQYHADRELFLKEIRRNAPSSKLILK